jgi:hypothetical protein
MISRPFSFVPEAYTLSPATKVRKSFSDKRNSIIIDRFLLVKSTATLVTTLLMLFMIYHLLFHRNNDNDGDGDNDCDDNNNYYHKNDKNNFIIKRD